MPMSPPQLLLLTLLLGAVAASTAEPVPPSVAGDPPTAPTPWPEQYHAVLLSNLTDSGGRLELIDVYYDWPRGRALNVLRDQLSDEPVFNVEWANGSSYVFDYSASSSCSATWHPVGILPPDWVDGAAYLGRDTVDGFQCHVWSHRFFSRYYEEVATGRPVSWNFVGSQYKCQKRGENTQQKILLVGKREATVNSVVKNCELGALRHVLSFKVGGVPPEGSPKWQAPASCFSGSNADAAHGADGEGNGADVMM